MSLQDLPQDILALEIASLLPIRDLERLAQTSRSLYHTTYSPIRRRYQEAVKTLQRSARLKGKRRQELLTRLEFLQEIPEEQLYEAYSQSQLFRRGLLQLLKDLFYSEWNVEGDLEQRIRIFLEEFNPESELLYQDRITYPEFVKLEIDSLGNDELFEITQEINQNYLI